MKISIYIFMLQFRTPVEGVIRLKLTLWRALMIQKNETLDIETARELNQRKAESARQRIREDAELAKIVNYNLTATAFDLMKSLPTPVLSTGVCYYKRQLWTYCFEIHNLATQEAVTYIWNDYH